MQPVTRRSRLLEAASKSHSPEYHQVFEQKTGGYSRFKMNDEIAYFLFFFFTQHETGERKTANLTEEVERHSAHGTLQLKMLEAVKAPLSLAWRSHPSAQSLHMCGSLGEFCAPFFSALFIFFAFFHFEHASCWALFTSQHGEVHTQGGGRGRGTAGRSPF